jgi:hypothetical protein
LYFFGESQQTAAWRCPELDGSLGLLLWC